MPRLLVDSGNVLFNSARGGSESTEKTITAHGMARIYTEMDYHAVAVGPFDLSGGLDLIKKTEENGMPWISANLYGHTGQRLFKPFVTIQTGGLRIAIVGLTGSGMAVDEQMELRDGVSELDKLVPTLAADHDMIILLSNLSQRQTKDVTKRFPEIKIVIGADRRRKNVSPFINNEALITQTGSQGKYLGVLSVFWGEPPWETEKNNTLHELNIQLQSMNRQVNRLQAEQDKTSESYKDKVLMTKTKRDRIAEAISSIDSALPENSTSPVNQSSFDSYFIALDKSIGEDRRISALVSSIKNRRNR